MASAGTGNVTHMWGELFKLMAGVDLQHVPYRGEAPAITDLLGGQVDVLFGGLPAALRVARGSLRGAIQGVDVIAVRHLGLGGNLGSRRCWQNPKPNRARTEANPAGPNAQSCLGRFEELCIANRLAFTQQPSGTCLLPKPSDGLFTAGEGLRQKVSYLRGPQVARGPLHRVIWVHS